MIIRMLSLILISSAKVNSFDRFEPSGGKEVEDICSKMGLTMTSAINVFLSKARIERRIPFEIIVDADPFYSESNIRHGGGIWKI